MSTVMKLTALVARTQADKLCVCVFASLKYRQTESELAITSRMPQLISRTLFTVSKIGIGEQGGARCAPQVFLPTCICAAIPPLGFCPP